MKKAAIIAVGTELTKGYIDDTNAPYLSRYLQNRGIDVAWRLNIKDDVDQIAYALESVQGCELVILIGGLGPTKDDCTREGVAQFLGKPLIFDEKAWQQLQQFFLKRYNKIPTSNKKQAYLILGGEFIPNASGTAPGILYKNTHTLYILLPGPPAENQPMIELYFPEILKKYGLLDEQIHTQIYRIYNIGESELADLLSAALKTNCDLGYYFSSEGWVELHISWSSLRGERDEQEFQQTMKDVQEIFITHNIFFTENFDLSYLLLEKLTALNLSIAFAESITGGLLSAELVKNPGASRVFIGGLVTYSNETKKALLGVTEETLQKYGAVSEQTVSEMVSGLKKATGADICLAVSGIAGPAGETPNKPVGLVYFSLLIKDKLLIKQQVFFGSRMRIIKRCINYILVELLQILKAGHL